MKAFAFVLLCALAAVQGRYTALQSTRSAAVLGQNPWVVHLRIAVGTSGLLETCGGSLIDSRWVLTAASCVSNARFVWIRYGAVNVINPSLVTETSTVRLNPGYNAATGQNNIGLVSINRYVLTTDNIGPVPPVGPIGSTGTVCGFGGQDRPGEVLNCYTVEVSEEDGALVVSSDDFEPSPYDVGAGVVSNGAQVGLLVDGSGKFLGTAAFTSWIEQETGLVLSPVVPDETTTESVTEVDPEAVHFV